MPEQGRRAPGREQRWPAAVALLIIAGVAVADVIVGDTAVLIGLMTSATLLCGLTTSPTVTRAVGIVAVSVRGGVVRLERQPRLRPKRQRRADSALGLSQQRPLPLCLEVVIASLRNKEAALQHGS